MAFDRNKYLTAVKSQVEPNVYTHTLSVEACMDGIYEYLKSNNQLPENEPPKDDWLLAGIIHDIDYGGEFKDTHPKNTRKACEKYGLELSQSVEQIVKAHAPSLTGIQPKTKAQWALFCLDSLTGLITAVAYVYPSRKLADVKVSSVTKRFLKEPRFAAGTRRDEVAMCQKPDGLNIPLDKFIEICLNSMQKISSHIGL